MKTLMIALLVLLPFQAIGDDADSQALGLLLDRFLDGAGSGDIAMHDHFWSDDLVYTSSAGHRFGKAELMAGLTHSPTDDPAAPVYSARDVRIRLFGELALIDFTLIAIHDDQTEQRFFNSGVLRLEGDQWRAINWQATVKAEP